jgi:hypothetical protein
MKKEDETTDQRQEDQGVENGLHTKNGKSSYLQIKNAHR